MEEGSQLRTKSMKRSNLQQRNSDIKIQDALMFPIYIVTSTYNSPHLKKLLNLLQNKKITVSFQNSVQSLQMITNTYQKSIFIVFNDFTQRPSIKNQLWQNRCECTDYPQCQDRQLLELYRKFVSCEKKKERMIQQRQSQKTAKKSEDRIQEDSIKQKDEDVGKPKIKLRSASKIIHNYKTVWPKKLFIYENRNDDKIFRDYICLIKDMQFDNACFINQIEDYVRFLPEKQDVCYCVLMSEYSALNLRKFFKRSDQILLFGQNDEECLPLLRGKVTYYSNQLHCINKLLANNFGMKKKNQVKQKIQPNLSKQMSEHNQVGEYQSQIQKQVSSKKHSAIDPIEDTIVQTKQEAARYVGENSQSNLVKQIECVSKYEGLQTYSSVNFKISPQFSYLNEPVKSQLLQSNTICFSYVPQKPKELSQAKQVNLNIQTINDPSKVSSPPASQKRVDLLNDKEVAINKHKSIQQIQPEHPNLTKDKLNQRDQFIQSQKPEIESQKTPPTLQQINLNNKQTSLTKIKDTDLNNQLPRQRTVSSQLQMQSMKENFFNSEIMKISPLKIVQIDIGSLANLSLHTSDLVQEKETFQQLLDKINIDEAQSKQHNFAKKKFQSEKKMNKKLSNLSNQKQNDISSDRESQGSRFSNTSSRNSRILGRINEVRKIKCRLPLESL